MDRLNVVLDTNVLLVSISKLSKYRPVFDAILNGKIELIITNEILSEYTEIIKRQSNAIVAYNIAELLASSVFVRKIEISYRWNLIKNDPDDNKFVDAAIAGRVKYVVTNDKDYNILKKIKFPKVDVITIQELMSIIKK